MKLTTRSKYKFFGLLAIGLSLFAVGSAFAANQSLGDIATNVTNSFEGFGKLLIAVSYVAGIGFTLAAIFKFKQHKDNPTQIPLGTPIALLVIGIVLVFLPMLFGPAGQTVFGSGAEVKTGGFQGQGVSSLPGAK